MFQSVVAELYQLYKVAELHLPTHRTAIQYQVRQLVQIQQRLKCLEQAIKAMPDYSNWTQAQKQLLIPLMKQAQQHVLAFILVAEEYASDPVGAIACLRQLDTQRSRLEFELEQLQNGCMRKAS
jgi:hypothetical protein